MDSINEILPKELEKLINEDKSVVVVDVREDVEVALGIIENAKHVPLQDIPALVNELNKNKHYVFVCRSGVRSLAAAVYLAKIGYQVSNMTGGMIEWQGEIII